MRFFWWRFPLTQFWDYTEKTRRQLWYNFRNTYSNYQLTERTSALCAVYLAIFPTKHMALYRSHCFALWWLPLSFAFSLNTRRGIEISGVGQFIQGGVESEGASLWNICAGKLFMDIFSWFVQLSMFKTHEKISPSNPSNSYFAVYRDNTISCNHYRLAHTGLL